MSDAAPTPRHRPRPVVVPMTPSRLEVPSQPGDVEQLEAVEQLEDTTSTTSGGVEDGLEDVVDALVDVLRATARLAGLSGEQLEEQVAATLGFLTRRVSGDYEVDLFGFDADFTEHVYLPLVRPLYRRWFRVDVTGIEHIPAEGGALIVSNHSGTMPWDSLMTLVAVHDEHPQRRHLRMLGADLVFRTPILADLSRKVGTTVAATYDAEQLLGRGEIVGVWPEGFKGVGKPFSERYRLQRFGRGGFVSAALRAGVPIIPCSVVGAEEIHPMLGNAGAIAKLLGFPYFPLTPTFPWLGLLGAVPLPTKWTIEFGAPIPTDGYPQGAAEDPMLVMDLTDQVRETIQQTLHQMLMRRRSVFLG
ncbi:acyltransferase family protein [Arsenicicoccus piscis]|uniref:Glycerol acyltransferase n=1 Tax=Arsenicicoccus piscis TaxID=673954 RepID=A0ABQ6HJG9_9MICO|nr:lysophospholipid acyltransferase family protein [Arsenicicoccus piscis]MCH8627681.1 acyltransferase family protein [Arsenicicoccus piscis]GMA18182.1 glycerol acyltransferase [Arsenicicoccus piscis]